jgi:hypothetical protein
MGHEMYYGFQNSPYLDLILSQSTQGPPPPLKALSLKRTKFQIFWHVAACHVDWVTTHQLTRRSIR